MTTLLSACRVELSKQINDYWASATTGAGSATTIVDALLKAKQNAWIGKDMYDLITEVDHDSEDEERLISSLNNTSGTLTVLDHDNTTGIGMDYEIHRLFTASEKRLALIAAARMAWPHIHEKIWDETLVSGNWLKDGSFEIWNSAGDALTHWTKSASAIVKTSTAGQFEHGPYSCKIWSGAGHIRQSVANWDDLKRLAGKSVTFTVRGWCNTASCLRISINDGVNDETFSSWHDGDSSWTAVNDPLTVTQVIDDNPTEVTFMIYHALESGAQASYVDDARVIGPYQPRLFIDQLGLAQETPVQIEIEPSNYSTDEPWIQVFNSRLDTESGYLYLPSSVQRDRRLRIKGIGYLDFVDSSGASATAWDSEININSPQTDILIAQAILYLYTQMSLPNFSRSTKQDFQEMIGFWERELRKRIGKHGMEVQSIPVRYR